MSRFRRAAVHLALVALMLRALLPAGWMPNPAAGSLFVICTMEGALQADGKAKPASNDPRAHEACPFAAAAHLSPPQENNHFAAPLLAAAMTIVPASQTRSVTRAPFAPQSPRAPPKIA